MSALATFLAVALPGLAQTESPHRRGPHGLEGWTLLASIDNQDELPMTLVIARNKRVVQTFPGDAFVWKWIFVNDGRQVAHETGPLHFAIACVPADIIFFEFQ